MLMAACSSATYLCIFRFAPYVYQYDLSDVAFLSAEFAEELSRYDREKSPVWIEAGAAILSKQYDDEYRLHVFTSRGEELTLPDLDGLTGKNVDDYASCVRTEAVPVALADQTEPYMLMIVQNADKRGQIVEALYRAIPAVSAVIFLTSSIVSLICAKYMTAPIRKMSGIAKQMADMDFSGALDTGRVDEIGVLSDSLNRLSRKLQAALSELRSANRRLQSDVDREKQLERQRLAFFSAASHELKTPITIIKGQLQGMLYQVGRYRDRETYLAQSLEVADTLEKMVREILTVSRLEAPGLDCRKATVDLSALIEERLASHAELFLQRGLTVEKRICPGLCVQGAPPSLRKAVDNLLGNAALYSGAGNCICVHLARESGKICFTIENTGAQIPEEDIPRLFEAFYRVDHSRSRQTGGTGLGLYIVKTILDLHGAEIQIANSSRGVRASIRF